MRRASTQRHEDGPRLVSHSFALPYQATARKHT